MKNGNRQSEQHGFICLHLQSNIIAKSRHAEVDFMQCSLYYQIIKQNENPKGKEMFTAYDAETNTDIPVKPMAVYLFPKNISRDQILIADANTGKGIRLSLDTPYFGCARHAYRLQSGMSSCILNVNRLK